ncbi:crotonase/enoyl-CoA hydratase family protein [Roseibium algae]|uniref:Crotonase/enoyl-CoA hydratase family protein n=1 Tax=Roseibium algae TaxID=3123038 RepID=A0ABU8THK6_9HYPH
MIQLSLEEGVSTLRLDRADKKNALTGAMYTVLAEALESGNSNDDVRCHLVCGQPGVFTAGNDIADFLQFAGDGDLSGTPVLRFLKALALNEKPLVAAVDGLAIGIGTTLLMHCDMVFASPGATFKTPFVDLGLVPEAGSSLLAPQIMGPTLAFELLCLGETFDAKRAQKAGLVNHIEDDVETTAMACVRTIAAKPAQAMQASRNLLKGDRSQLLQRVEEEARIFGERLLDPETIAVFQAFMTKNTKC